MKENSKRKYLSMWLDKFRHVHDDKLKCLNELSSFFADHPNLSEFGDKATEPNARKNSYSSQQKLFWIIYSFFIYSIILWNSFFELLRFKKFLVQMTFKLFRETIIKLNENICHTTLYYFYSKYCFFITTCVLYFGSINSIFFAKNDFTKIKILPWRKIGKA